MRGGRDADGDGWDPCPSGLLRTISPVNAPDSGGPETDLSSLRSMPRDVPEPPTEFAKRLETAMAAAKKSPTRTEREAGLQRGYISQVRSGKIRSPNPETCKLIADYLGVGFEWLAIGRGPMHANGWAPTPLEEAILFAVRANTRRDAIDAAIARYRDSDLSALEWVLAFDVEARHLDREGVPRPEEIEKAQKRVKRLGRAIGKRRGRVSELQAKEAEVVPLLPPAPKKGGR
jgi:transcriptional regulator with XRE-family HTH domain